MSSVTQDDYHQSSNVLLSIWDCDKGNKEHWYCVFCGNEYNLWNSTKSLVHLTISGGYRISKCRGEILPKYQHQFKALKEKKEVFRNQRV